MKANISNTEEKKAAPRPLILEIDDAKAEIAQGVNSALKRGLPCYIVADILENILSQARIGARNELAAAKEQEEKKSEEVEK